MGKTVNHNKDVSILRKLRHILNFSFDTSIIIYDSSFCRKGFSFFDVFIFDQNCLLTKKEPVLHTKDFKQV